jgi:hypothetical protein
VALPLGGRLSRQPASATGKGQSAMLPRANVRVRLTMFP